MSKTQITLAILLGAVLNMSLLTEARAAVVAPCQVQIGNSGYWMHKALVGTISRGDSAYRYETFDLTSESDVQIVGNGGFVISNFSTQAMSDGSTQKVAMVKSALRDYGLCSIVPMF